jgi:hypothetical protein
MWLFNIPVHVIFIYIVKEILQLLDKLFKLNEEKNVLNFIFQGKY